MSATKAEALAVALDYAEETGEYPIELRERLGRMMLDMQILVLRRVAGGDGDWVAHTLAGHIALRLHDRPPFEWYATVHTAVSGTSKLLHARGSYEETMSRVRRLVGRRGWVLVFANGHEPAGAP